MAHPQEGQSKLHREFQDGLRSVSALTEIPQANRTDGTPVQVCESHIFASKMSGCVNSHAAAAGNVNDENNPASNSLVLENISMC